MKKIASIIAVLLCAPLLCSVFCPMASAAPRPGEMVITPGNIPVEYLPGTKEVVNNMPVTPDGFTRYDSYVVSDETPERNGYEFIGWELNYDWRDEMFVMARYVNSVTFEEIAPSSISFDYGMVFPGDTVTVYAFDVGGYILISDPIMSEIMPDQTDYEFDFYYFKRKIE